MYQRRRATLMENMGAGSVGVWFASPSRLRSVDTDYRYRPASDLFYLTGCEEPGALLVLRPGAEKEQVVLFVRPRDAEREIWDGRRVGPVRAVERFGVDASYSTEEIGAKLPELLVGAERLFHNLGKDESQDRDVVGWLNQARRHRRTGKKTPSSILDAGELVHAMRLCKDASELEIMREAAKISAEAHTLAMETVRPGMYEYELESMFQYHFRKHGCEAPAYLPIVGGGGNAAILHYVENNEVLKDGDLVLIDAGAEYKFYAADITRTFPVNGVFSDKQKQVYEIVLRALEAGIACCKPGNRFNDVHEAAVRELTAGLVELGVLEGDVETFIKEEAYKPYYMHKTGHWLGMDVHDVGGYFEDDESSRVFVPGMVLTVEPGLYFNPSYYTDPKAEPYANIGIRIEDNILITEQGYENLTVAAPKTVAEIEAAAKKRRSLG